MPDGTHPVSAPTTTARPASVIALLLVLVASGAPMLVALGARDSTHTMENVALVTSQETWLRGHDGERGAWRLTSNDGAQRVRKPPMLAWLHLLAWADLDPATVDPALLVLRARLVAVAQGLLLVAAVFVLGNALGGARTAIVAALVCGTTLFLQRQARTASYDVHLAACAAWGVAALAWSSVRPCRRRLLVGAAGAGVATAAAIMGKNPSALVFVAAGVGAIALCLPARRRMLLVGLPLALVVAGALVAPWYAWVLRTVPGGAAELLRETGQARPGAGQPAWYYVGIVMLVLPWTAWLVAGLVHPFVPTARGERRERLVAWTWFVGLLVLLSIPGAKQQRYLLPALPAAALLIARVWCDHQRLADRGVRDRTARAVVVAHWALLLACSAGLAVGALVQEPVVARFAEWRIALADRFAPGGTDEGLANMLLSDDNWPVRPFLGPLAWPAAVVLGAALVGLAAWGAVEHRRWRPLRAAAATVAWSIVFFGALWHLYSGAPTGVHPVRAPAEAFRARIAGLETAALELPGDPAGVLNEEFRFYAVRRFPRFGPDALAARVAARPEGLVVLARDEPAHAAVARDLGLADAGTVTVGVDDRRRVWLTGAGLLR